MAVDVSEVQSVPVDAPIPASAPLSTPEAPASPPVEAPRSPSFRESLTERFFRRGEAGRAETESAGSDATPPAPVVESPAPTRAPEPASQPYRAYQSEQEWQSEIQRHTDQELARRERLGRDKQIAEYEQQIEAATEADDTWQAGELAKQLAILKKGGRVEQTQAQTQAELQGRIEEAHNRGRFSAAADLDTAYTAPLSERLEEAARKELGDWFTQQSQDGRVNPLTLRQKYTERAITAFEAQIEERTRNQVFDKLDPSSADYDPEFTKLAIAHHRGGIDEPPVLSGSPTGGVPHFSTYDELVMAHADGTISNAEYRRQRGRFS